MINATEVDMSLKICPNCRLRLHKLCARCHCGYDFKQKKVIPFDSVEERDITFDAQEKAAIEKAKKIAKGEMIGGSLMCAVGIVVAAIQIVTAMEIPFLSGKMSLTPILLGLGVFIKGFLNYFTGEAEDFS